MNQFDKSKSFKENLINLIRATDTGESIRTKLGRPLEVDDFTIRAIKENSHREGPNTFIVLEGNPLKNIVGDLTLGYTRENIVGLGIPDGVALNIGSMDLPILIDTLEGTDEEVVSRILAKLGLWEGTLENEKFKYLSKEDLSGIWKYTVTIPTDHVLYYLDFTPSGDSATLSYTLNLLVRQET